MFCRVAVWVQIRWLEKFARFTQAHAHTAHTHLLLTHAPQVACPSPQSPLLPQPRSAKLGSIPTSTGIPISKSAESALFGRGARTLRDARQPGLRAIWCARHALSHPSTPRCRDPSRECAPHHRSPLKTGFSAVPLFAPPDWSAPSINCSALGTSIYKNPPYFSSQIYIISTTVLMSCWFTQDLIIDNCFTPVLNYNSYTYPYIRIRIPRQYEYLFCYKLTCIYFSYVQ